jgi:hypothetical protein
MEGGRNLKLIFCNKVLRKAGSEFNHWTPLVKRAYAYTWENKNVWVITDDLRAKLSDRRLDETGSPAIIIKKWRVFTKK